MRDARDGISLPGREILTPGHAGFAPSRPGRNDRASAVSVFLHQHRLHKTSPAWIPSPLAPRVGRLPSLHPSAPLFEPSVRTGDPSLMRVMLLTAGSGGNRIGSERRELKLQRV